MKRNTLIDDLRGFGIVLVVLVHSLGYTRHVLPLPDALFWFSENWLHSFLMPFFVFINGYSFYQIYVKNGIDTDRIMAYLYRLVQIYLVFGTSVVFVKYLFSQFTIDKVTSTSLLVNILIPDTTLWYIWFLIIMTLVFLVWKRYTSQSVSQSVSQRYRTVLLAGFIILAIFFGGPLHLSQLPLSIQHLTSLPMFYYLGYCLSKYEEISIFTRKSRMTAIIIFLSYIIYYAFYLNEGLTGGVTKDISIATFLRYVNAFAMTIVLFEFTKHLIEYGNKRVRDLGQNSLYIYLLHTYFLAVIAILLKKLSITSTFLILVALFLGAMLLSLFSVKIIKSVKILDKLFTGKLVK